MAGVVRSGRMKRKREEEEEETKQESRSTEREREQDWKVSESAWPRKIHQAKNSICHFICDGRSEALCHMTYPSYRARRDTSIHLFRHLTCLEQGTEEKSREEERERVLVKIKRWKEEERKRSLSVMRPLRRLCSSATLRWHTRQCANGPNTLFYTISPFYGFPHTHTCSCTQEQKRESGHACVARN